MTIPLTIVGPERSTDVVLPVHVPLAVLSQELTALTGHPCARLLSLTGRELDPESGLVDNGVAGGALLLARSDLEPAPIIEDVADAAARQSATVGPGHRLAKGEVALALVVAAMVGWTAHLDSVAPLAVLCLATLLGWVALPRLVLRLYGLDAGADPTDAQTSERLGAARRATLRVGRGLAVCALVGGVVLANESGVPAVVTGWMVLLAVTFRVAGHDRVASIAVLVAAATALATGVQSLTGPALGAALLGALTVASALSGTAHRPLARVLRQYAERTLTVILPIALLASSGLLPPLPT